MLNGNTMPVQSVYVKQIGTLDRNISLGNRRTNIQNVEATCRTGEEYVEKEDRILPPNHSPGDKLPYACPATFANKIPYKGVGNCIPGPTHKKNERNVESIHLKLDKVEDKTTLDTDIIQGLSAALI